MPFAPVFRFSANNFDVIRLVAASEVAVRHSAVHIGGDWLPRAIDAPLAFIPGVPIFFFLSGYLISRAFERSPSLADYVRNRALRLFPGLWVCVAFALALLFISGYMKTCDWNARSLVLWVVGQSTVFQVWNPVFLREFGVGVVNGSLWTIAVEIQFYVVVALLLASLRSFDRAGQNRRLAWVTALFFGIAALLPVLEEPIRALPLGDLAWKVLGVSFVPWFYMFMLGTVAQRSSDWIIPLILRHRMALIAAYVAAIALAKFVFRLPLGNDIPWYLVPIMAAAVLSVAYSAPGFSERVLRGNDISYGLYIYHMPVVNGLLAFGVARSGMAAGTAVALAAVAALLSWRFVERPCLRRKRSAMRPVLEAAGVDGSKDPSV
jgi:peptidoglycan/LPS O-acetylase OafA/YrhL